MVARLRRALRHPVARNAIALYWVQIATFVLPLITLPYVSRVLGPSEFGLVLFGQGFGLVLIVVIEWGLMYHGIRAASEERDDPEALGRLVAWVRSGQLVLALAAALVAAVALLAVHRLAAHPEFIVLGWVTGVASGLNPSWYFFGLERLNLVSKIQLGLRATSTVLTFVLVRSPGDAWIMMALFAGSAVAMWLVSDVLMYRETPFVLPRLRDAFDSLRTTASLFLGVAAASLYTSMNVVLLGFFVPSAQVAHFGAPERVVRASLQALAPIGAAAYPRLTHLQATGDHAGARRLFLLAVAILAGIGLAIAAALAALAPVVIRIVFGSAFVAESVPIMRVLVLLIPLNVAGVVVGGWLLSLHLERVVVRAVLVAGVLNVALACALVPSFGAQGLAWSVVLAELTAASGALVALYRIERDSAVRILPRFGRASSPG